MDIHFSKEAKSLDELGENCLMLHSKLIRKRNPNIETNNAGGVQGMVMELKAGRVFIKKQKKCIYWV